jgi:hypothetical protein
MSTPNLLELLQNLLRDPTAYREDPEGFLSSAGDVSPEDIREALILLQDRQDSDLGRVNNTGGNHVVHVPPPAAAPEPGESNQEAAVRYLDTYVTGNHVDDSDDNSVSQQTEPDEGDFDQDIDADSVLTSDDELEDSDDDEDEDEDDDEDDDEDATGDEDDEDSSTDDDDKDDDEGDEGVAADDDNVGFGDGDTSATEIDGGTSADDGETSTIDSSPHDSDDPTTDFTDSSDTSVDGAYDDNSTYTDDDTATTDSHPSTQEAYSTEVV